MNLFEGQLDWKDEWLGMPEFVQKDKTAVQKIVLSFETKEDIKKFEKITGYKITPKTNSLWFPFRKKDTPRKYGYVDGE